MTIAGHVARYGRGCSLRCSKHALNSRTAGASAAVTRPSQRLACCATKATADAATCFSLLVWNARTGRGRLRAETHGREASLRLVASPASSGAARLSRSALHGTSRVLAWLPPGRHVQRWLDGAAGRLHRSHLTWHATFGRSHGARRLLLGRPLLHLWRCSAESAYLGDLRSLWRQVAIVQYIRESPSGRPARSTRRLIEGAASRRGLLVLRVGLTAEAGATGRFQLELGRHACAWICHLPSGYIRRLLRATSIKLVGGLATGADLRQENASLVQTWGTSG